MLRIIAFFSLALASLLSLALSSNAWAWGEMGHDTVGRVAVRLLADKNAPDLARVLASKEHMIGHLSNVPDIHWKNIGKHIDVQNNSTHYVDAELVLPNGSKTTQEQLPLDITGFVNGIQHNCKQPKDGVALCAEGKTMSDKLQKSGTAPLRVQQLMEKMRDAMIRARQAKTRTDMVHAVNEAILYGGIASHFFGDLAQPLHVSINYDGWLNGAGGLHAYFESDVVDAQGLGLPQRVYERAKAQKPAAALRQKYPAKTQQNFAPALWAWWISLDSLALVDKLYAMDREHSLLKKSIDGKKRRKAAERKPPQTVAPVYADLVEERLALAADALADAWIAAWKEAGSPTFKDYHSWNYPLAPDFIKPSYLGVFQPQEKVTP